MIIIDAVKKLKEIEVQRKKLSESVSQYGLSHPKTLRISKEMDKLCNQAMRQQLTL